MVSENLDNDQNLPEHEVALMKHVRSTISGLAGVTTAGPRSDEGLWVRVKKRVSETLGGR